MLDIMQKYKQYHLQIQGVELLIQDLASSDAVPMIAAELERDCYGLSQIPFCDGDVVLDIGGHVGCFSILLGRLYRKLHIYAFEPLAENIENFRHNLMLNNVRNVQLIPQAVTADGRDVNIHFNRQNTGAGISSENYALGRRASQQVNSLALDAIFKAYQIQRCKLLKLDCEGFEFELLYHSRHLAQVDYLSAEVHLQPERLQTGRDLRTLRQYCERFIPADQLRFESVVHRQRP